MANYAKSAEGARQSFKRNGKLCALTWTPPPLSDAPDAPPPAPLTFAAYGVIFDYGYKQLGTQVNSLIEAGDRQVLLSVFDETTGGALPEPPPESKIIAPDGVEYTIKRVQPLAPAGVPVMYDLNVRK